MKSKSKSYRKSKSKSKRKLKRKFGTVIFKSKFAENDIKKNTLIDQLKNLTNIDPTLNEDQLHIMMTAFLHLFIYDLYKNYHSEPEPIGILLKNNRLKDFGLQYIDMKKGPTYLENSPMYTNLRVKLDENKIPYISCHDFLNIAFFKYYSIMGYHNVKFNPNDSYYKALLLPSEYDIYEKYLKNIYFIFPKDKQGSWWFW